MERGHTHYHKVANDGRTILMITRSTGQIEEGSAGFSIAAVEMRVQRRAWSAMVAVAGNASLWEVRGAFWEERHVFDTQLGPNRNGLAW